MVQTFHMLEISTILIEHLAEEHSKARSRVPFEHHLVEINQTSLLQYDADIAPWHMDHTMSASSLDVNLLVRVALSDGDRLDEHPFL